jgi:hypothetical protein
MKTLLGLLLMANVATFMIGAKLGFMNESRVCAKDVQHIIKFSKETTNSRIGFIVISTALVTTSPGFAVGLWLTEDHKKCK